MTEYGGLGGFVGGRDIDPEDKFEMTVAKLFGEKLRDDEHCEQMGRDIWSALANVDWFHENGDTASYSFRAAGDLIAAIRGCGDYLDWYCSGPYSTVSDEIAEAMAREGWQFKADEI